MISSLVGSIKPSITLAVSSKARELKEKGENIVDFGVGEPDFPTPQNVKDAGIKAIKEDFTKYTSTSGTIDLKKAIIRKLKTVNNLNYDTDQVIVSCGGKHSLFNVMMSVLEPKDEVLIPTPYWVSYVEQVRLTRSIPIMVSTDDNYKIRSHLIEEKITEKSRLLILNSPSNPTGMVCDKKELEKIAELVLKHNLIVISDEVYEYFIYDNIKHVSFASLNKEIYEKTIVCNSLSKTYSMTGWRIGYTVGPRDVINAMNSLQSHTTSNPNSIAQKAAVEALNGTQEHIPPMIEEFNKRRDYMISRLNEIDCCNCIIPEGAFYAFPNIKKSGLKSVDFAQKLLEKSLVAVVPGTAFGSDYNIRLSYAISLDVIEEGIDRLEKFCNTL